MRMRINVRVSHSYVWQQQTMYFDITWLFEWSDIPAVVRDYITSRAASFVAMRIVGDPNLYQILSQQEAYMRATAMEWDTQQGDYTFFGHERGSNYYRPYKPFHALYR
jgi:hypothetical protein